MEPPDPARPSLYKACLVAALSSTMREVLSENNALEVLAFYGKKYHGNMTGRIQPRIS